MRLIEIMQLNFSKYFEMFVFLIAFKKLIKRSWQIVFDLDIFYRKTFFDCVNFEAIL
jgi:hypothetical protein